MVSLLLYYYYNHCYDENVTIKELYIITIISGIKKKEYDRSYKSYKNGDYINNTCTHSNDDFNTISR